MENDIAKILATKRDWRKAERRKTDRRVKDGTIEQRKDTADALRRGRHQIGTYCSCSMCEINEEPNLFSKIIKWFYPVIILFFLCGSAHAYTASWYGTTDDTTDPWKHTTTANGEHFNENALTAASWKYAFGTLVRVTNVANHRSVIVRINDRGPGRRLYRKGRIIDLTRASFSRIAPLSAGVIHVIVRIL